MIVADASIIAGFYLEKNEVNLPNAVRARDREWVAPGLWRYELNNALLKYIRANMLGLPECEAIVSRAAVLIAGREQEPTAAQILNAAVTYKISAYDATYVALAQHLRLPLVTLDQRLCRAAPKIAVLPSEFLAHRE